MRKTGSTISCLWPCKADHARMPVTMPRYSDSDMCRDGASTATEQSKTPVDEHGKVHSVSDLNRFVLPRTMGSKRRQYPAKEEKHDMTQPMESCPQIKGQDKRDAISRHPSGWGLTRISYGTCLLKPYRPCRNRRNLRQNGMATLVAQSYYGFIR